jgi:hypothetical protein
VVTLDPQPRTMLANPKSSPSGLRHWG